MSARTVVFFVMTVARSHVVRTEIKTAFPTGPIRLEIAGLKASMRLSGAAGAPPP